MSYEISVMKLKVCEWVKSKNERSKKMKKIIGLLLGTALLIGLAAFYGEKDVSASAISFSSSAMDVAQDMKVGWNLGNSLDAYDYSGGNETAWNNPTVTRSLIQLVKAEGFNTIRIPVTYMNRIGDGPNYTIEEAWLNRVQEVVDFAIDENLYVIINIQADGNHDYNYGAWLHIDDADQTTIRAKYQKVWEQISSKFKDYGVKLIFESMNEAMEQGNYGTPEYEDTYNNINTLNQIFVDTVRTTGSNNVNRFLLVPGYNTDIYNTVILPGFELPQDTATDKLMVSVHFYDPYDFTLNESNDTIYAWGQTAIDNGNTHAVTWHNESSVQTSLSYVYNAFTSKGIPVVFGEYGAVDKSFVDSANNEYRRYYYEYVTKAIGDIGAVGICWDNGWTGNYGLALFDRSNNTVAHQEIIDGIMRGASGQNYTITQPQTSNAIINPTSASFDWDAPSDIPIVMSLNGNTFTDIMNGNSSLISGIDYTLSQNIVTIKKEYLQQLSPGTIILNFNFSSGAACQLVISEYHSSSEFMVEFCNSEKSISTSALTPMFKLTNAGVDEIYLPNVKLRYYYTVDGIQTQNLWCDWSSIGSENVLGTFTTLSPATETADCYAEIGFTSDAGMLAPNQSVYIQLRIAKTDWSSYNQSNDYSFNSTANTYVDWDRVTSYISGTLYSGIEP